MSEEATQSNSMDEALPSQSDGNPSPQEGQESQEEQVTSEPEVEQSYFKSLLKEIDQEIKAEEEAKNQDRMVKDKEIVKELYKEFKSELDSTKEENTSLKAKLAELEKRISSISSGSKSQEPESNPMQKKVVPPRKDGLDKAMAQLKSMGLYPQ